MPLLILMPLFNDWASAKRLLHELDTAFAPYPDPVEILLVNDASRDRMPPAFTRISLSKLRGVHIMRLKTNMGHQRAIAIGLCHVHERVACRGVVVMDSDGEDLASDAVRLAETGITDANRDAIFAQRVRRSESMPFRIGYMGYRVLHGILTGRDIRVGNFSFLHRQHLEGLTVDPMLWNHYAAAVRNRLPIRTIPTNRGKRFYGKSHLNMIHLIAHGLAAFPCYSEIIGVRLMVGTVVLSLTGLWILGACVIYDPGIFSAGLAGDAILVLFSLLLALGCISILFLIIVNLMRTQQPFLPARDYQWYVGELAPLIIRASSSAQ